ncbi:MAG: hypothetical protein R6V49_02900, partial [Bacteroidales bacterium]
MGLADVIANECFSRKGAKAQSRRSQHQPDGVGGCYCQRMFFTQRRKGAKQAVATSAWQNR